MLRFRAVSNILRARLIGKKCLEDSAIHFEVLEERSTEKVAPLAFLPTALERVTAGVPGHSTAAEELAQAQTDTFEHAPVVRYVLRDCLLHAGGIEYRGGFRARTAVRGDRFPQGPIARHAARSWCMSLSSHTYFGHWLSDSCATALLAEAGPPAVLDDRPDWSDAAAYARAFGLTTTPVEACHVAELHVYSDHAQGASKRARYTEMKARLRRSMGPAPAERRPVYLRRGDTGNPRGVADEDALCARLAAEGFDILDLATSGFAERYRRLAAADILVSMDGSHVGHGHFAQSPGSALVTLIPADRFTMVHRGIAHAMGLRYGCVVAERTTAGYAVSADEVLRTTEMVA